MRPEQAFHRISSLTISLVLAVSMLPSSASAANDSVARLIQTWTQNPGQIPGGWQVHAQKTSAKFYAARSYREAWTSGGRLTPQAQRFVGWLEQLHQFGIDASDYHLRTLRELSRTSGSLSPEKQARADLLWTDAWLLVASHLYSGRINPETIDPEWFSNRRDRDFAVALENALASGDAIVTLDALHPPQAAYARLVKALAEYRNIASRGGWASVNASGKLELGMQDAAIPALRARLRATGEFGSIGPDQDTEFDATLREAVIRFQKRMGLETDGVVGSATLQALNVPVETRIHQLMLNLERWRWFPQSLGERHVLVNIAGFDLVVREHEIPVLEMDVIVGRNYRRTPVFSGNISYMVFNPTWTVPYNLAVQDKLPALVKDPGLLKRENFVVLNPSTGVPVPTDGIKWSQFSRKHFPYTLRQNPGPNNALGQVKFMFPNSHNVYLHDTPNHKLFSSAKRSFSSGCIRLSQPLKLAETLLSFDGKLASTNIRQILETGRETTVKMSTSVPVHLTYWTAWADPDGTIQFREDIYGRDARLWAALERNANQTR